MFSRSKGWMPGLLFRPKNPHSLEHLKYLYSLLCKNQIVHENNRSLLVETLRSISEILIWGDQNDSSVFDFFLEKNMLSFFLRYLQQKSGRYICVQLLQTLNILFENISNETSLYYLLSNNHVNSIIVHRFDFSDEEVMAYYISFLKTLSLKLNRHTIHFFYNEDFIVLGLCMMQNCLHLTHTNDFALYTEAIKFFKHSETMVRIAVRTITLNVFRVEDKAMLRYIKDRTAAPYFSNLVWFIGMHILDLDSCVRNDADHQSRNWLADLVAEHLDHLHYLNDILCIKIDALNDVLTDQLLNRLLIPLYVYSLTKRKKHTDRKGERKHVGSVVSLFLLSQVFLIISYSPLVRQLAEIIFQGEINLTTLETSEDSPKTRVREFTAPEESLEKTLESNRGCLPFRSNSLEEASPVLKEGNSTFYSRGATGGHDDKPSSPDTEGALSPSSEIYSGDTDVSSPNQNSTDEEKLMSSLTRHRMELPGPVSTEQKQAAFSLENRPYLESVFMALECSENDYEALFALCLLYAMGHNDGIHQGLMDSVLMPTEKCETKDHYNIALVERLIRIITLASQHDSKVRLCTLELTIKLLKQLVYTPNKSYLQDRHLACIEAARECSTQLLRNFYKSEEIFLDMFEDEYRGIKNKPLNVEYLTMDASILLPPTGTPLTGIEFSKRLPCGEVERARKAIRVFFLVRDLSLNLLQEEETQLPLTKENACVKVNEILDLNNSDLIACTVLNREKRQERRFLVIDSVQMILVEPDTKRLGWGVVRFVGFLQDVEVTGDKEDSRSLHITIHKPASSTQHTRALPLLSARFLFDDHIRCMAAKQRLTKGRIKARQQKMQMIERLLDIPMDHSSSHTPVNRSRAYPGRGHAVRVSDQSTSSPSASSSVDTSQSQRPGRRTLPHPPEEKDKSSAKQGKIKASTEREDSVELAEEASSFAYQSFNQHTGGAVPNRHSPSPVEGGSQVQEIPLEDLSRKKKKHSGRKMSDSKLVNLSGSGSHNRSHSHSPKRHEGIKPSSRGRSTSLAYVMDKQRERSITPVRRSHSKSSPPIPASVSNAKHRTSSTSSDDGDDTVKKHRSHEDSLVGQSPKTLRPAEAPTLSLLPPDNNGKSVLQSTNTDSPKLIPPVEIDRIRSLSDTSSTSSSGSQSDVSLVVKCNVSKEDGTQPKFAYKQATGAEVEVSKAQVERSSLARAHGEQKKIAADQLTKFAQIVQEHYRYYEDEGQERNSFSQDSSNTSG